MFKIHLVKIHGERNPEFHLQGEWRYSKGGMSELMEGDMIMVESGEYYHVREKSFQGDVEVVKIQLLDEKRYLEERYLGLNEGYKLLANIMLEQ